MKYLKHLKTFESYEEEEEMKHKGHEEEEETDEEKNGEEEVKESKWIQDAIKSPGSLRRSMRKKKGEKISMGEINSELSALKKKDRDPDKAGVQLGKSDAKKYKRLNLAKTLRGFK